MPAARRHSNRSTKVPPGSPISPRVRDERGRAQVKGSSAISQPDRHPARVSPAARVLQPPAERRRAKPMTMATDYVLAAWLVWLGVRLLGPESPWARRFWGVAFLVGGATAALGGTVHGFAHAFSLQAQSLLWNVIASGIAATGLALLAATAVATVRGNHFLRLILLALAARAVADLVSGATGDFTFSLYDGVAGLLGVLASGAHGLLRGRPDARFLLAGVLVCLGGAYAQMARLVPHRQFNHNDLFHVVLVLGAGLLFQAAQRFAQETTPTADS
jgi:hypothetical protein